jgi:diguanylate cyclase (GGDEF)-like protein
MPPVHELKNSFLGTGPLGQPPDAEAGRSLTRPGQSLRSFIAHAERLSLILLQITDYSLLEHLYGDLFLKEIQDTVTRSLRQASSKLEHDADPDVGICVIEAGEFGIIRKGPDKPADLLDTAFALRMEVQNEIRSWLLKNTGLQVKIRVGFGSTPVASASPENDLLKILAAARTMCANRLDLAELSLAKEYQSILSESRTRVVYQPILDFSTGQTLGWEALSRGPARSSFESPVFLFDFAEESGSLFELEKVCRQKAIAHCSPMSRDQKLFLNIHPQTLIDPGFTPGETRRILEDIGLEPDNVVFEITERHSIKDFALFHKTLTHYRSQGFKVAVDDVGTGYSGLWSIAQIRPDFIKIDMSLVQGIDRDPVKRSLLETFVTFADKIGSQIIAEGIETETVFSSLLSMGVHFGQGYFFSKPEYPKKEMTIPLEDKKRSLSFETAEDLFSIRNLVQETTVVQATTPVTRVKSIMSQHGPLGSVVVARGDTPVGLVMSYHLDRQLASRYGVALYSKRDVTVLMDDAPLVVDAAEPVERVARLATTREKFKAYDDIIVTQDNMIIGVVSVQKLIDSMAKFQVEMAKGANPLTGLPGNVALESELEKRLAKMQPFSIIYADLDNFKVYNDLYGFQNGDQIIQLLARIMKHALARHGSRSDLVSHVGGDDFIIVTSIQDAERISLSIVRCFKRLIRNYFSPKDLERGWIEAQGRDGRSGRFPLVSVSLGIVRCTGQTNLKAISERAAEVKTYAKSRPGSTYVSDRRAPLGGGA